jgi:hypothetical protein
VNITRLSAIYTYNHYCQNVLLLFFQGFFGETSLGFAFIMFSRRSNTCGISGRPCVYAKEEKETEEKERRKEKRDVFLFFLASCLRCLGPASGDEIAILGRTQRRDCRTTLILRNLQNNKTR